MKKTWTIWAQNIAGDWAVFCANSENGESMTLGLEAKPFHFKSRISALRKMSGLPLDYPQLRFWVIQSS